MMSFQIIFWDVIVLFNAWLCPQRKLFTCLVMSLALNWGRSNVRSSSPSSKFLSRLNMFGTARARSNIDPV